VSIRQEAKKAQLADATEGYRVMVYTLEPFGSYLMVDVTVGSESDPDIDIWQVDHRS
jgi:hypothetical protein